MNKRPVNIMLDEETLEHLERLQGVYGGSRSDAIRRAAKAAVEALANPRGRTAAVESPVRPEPVTIVEDRKTQLPVMMTARELFAKQQRERERRRGDETDQRGRDEDL